MIFDIAVIAAAVLTAVLLLKYKANVGLLMFVESIFLAVIARLDPADFFDTVFGSIRSYSTLKLVIVFIFIMILENILRKTGMLKDISDSLKEMVRSNRIAAGILPVVVGLLPSPGGARFSCPMVEEVAAGKSGKGDLVFVNYWFRHVWMDGFMLYPGIIIAAELLNIDILPFFIRLLPFMIFTMAVGYFAGLRKIKREKIDHTRSGKENLIIFARSIAPVLSVVFLYMILIGITDYALEISLAVVSLLLIVIKRYTFSIILKTLKESFPYKLIIIIAGVMIFKDTLFRTGILDTLPGFLDNAGIPVFLAFLVLPFLTGLSSGIALSFVSMSFPILLTLGLADNIWYSVLAYVSGYIGMMISPLHLCMVATNEYFGHSIVKTIKKVAVSEIPLASIVVLIMVLLN